MKFALVDRGVAMFGYVVRRVLSGISVVFVVTVASFVLFFVGPTQPEYAICGDRNCTPDRLADIRQSLALDQPVITQFTEYFTGIFTGREIITGGFTKECAIPCLGYSYVADEPVTKLIAERVPVTISVALGAMAIAVAVGVTLGTYAAINRGTLLDKVLVGSSLVIVSLPYYIVALLAAIYLSIQFEIFPRGGYVPLTESPIGWFKGLILAWLVLGLASATNYARFTRAAMVEALGEDFVRTARAKGLGPRKINFRHALRAALTSVVTILGLNLAEVLAGTIFTERIFDVHGLGLLALNAFNVGDLPLIMGSVIYSTMILVTLNLVVDVAYGLLDPRVKVA